MLEKRGILMVSMLGSSKYIPFNLYRLIFIRNFESIWPFCKVLDWF